jgi:hypothetical protein
MWPGSQGAEFDSWLRMPVDAHLPLDLPLTGLMSQRSPACSSEIT